MLDLNHWMESDERPVEAGQPKASTKHWVKAMTPQNRYFILAEAAKLVPLVRTILVQVRATRSRLSRLARLLDRVDWTDAQELELRQQRSESLETLQECLAEASRLGVEITPGIRCEALFPFEHRWTGPFGDYRIRPAYFVYNDSQPSISQWFFSGWPKDRREIAEHWWSVTRPTASEHSSNA